MLDRQRGPCATGTCPAFSWAAFLWGFGTDHMADSVILPPVRGYVPRGRTRAHAIGFTAGCVLAN
ncbi:MAG: hypothetical protein L3K26_12415 [Candidatus Hydrogenedentes bacterium]|nr:hypothetical protein [Candidatus Hydrogenedentota bacterium]